MVKKILEQLKARPLIAVIAGLSAVAGVISFLDNLPLPILLLSAAGIVTSYVLLK